MRIGQKLSISLLILIISNIFTGVTTGYGIIYYLTDVAIFVLISIPLILLKKEFHFKAVSILLLIISIIFSFMGEATDITGFTLFLFSLAICKRKNYIYVIYFSMFFSSFLYNFNFSEMLPSQVGAYMAGLAFVGIIYQHYIHPKPVEVNPQPITLKSYDSRKVKDDVVDIVHLRTMGFNWDEINDKLSLCVTDDRVRRIVADERKRLGFNNQDQLVLWLLESGILKPISDKLII